MKTNNSPLGDRFWFCPLYSFQCTSEIVDLVEGIKIIKLPKYLRYDEEYRYGPPWSDEGYVEFGASFPSPVNMDPQDDFERAFNLSLDLLSALRLSHKGMVASGELIHIDSTGIIPNTTRLVNDLDHVTFTKFNRPLEPIYRFTKSAIQMVNKLITEIWKIKGPNKSSTLAETLRRFNSSYSGEPEDRLIDQMISFESLYIGDDKELGYKLALRTAFFLGKRRKQIFSDMKQAYDLRGKVVHGTKKVDLIEIEKIIPKTEEYLRQSIRKFLLLLSQGKSLKAIRQLLDENILKNGKLLTLR